MLKIWKTNKSNDYKMIDRSVAEQYRISGTDMHLYVYEGSKGTPNSNDTTKPSNEDGKAKITDLVLGENNRRKYNLEAIRLPVVYQIQEATPDFKIPGIMYNFETMDITMHYNTMIQLVGRKIIAGDVLELPNLRDTDLYDNENGAQNKFYYVVDGFRSSTGYSVTWLNHIYKIRVKPLTDSPEFKDFFKNNDYPDKNDPNNPNSGDSNDSGLISSYDKEMALMNAIINQADVEAPYIHWNNEHFYNSYENILNIKDAPTLYEFPDNPKENTLIVKISKPELYMNDGDWVKINTSVLNYLPDDAEDEEFIFVPSSKNKAGYELYQYDESSKKFYICNVDFSTEPLEQINTNKDFIILYKESELYLYRNSEWIVYDEIDFDNKNISKDVIGNIIIHDDKRPMIPPARGTVGEGTSFPDEPKDKEYFYRTDYKPITLWQYNKSESKWSMFDYGGRLPWTGADNAKTSLINSEDKVLFRDILKPNIKYRDDK